MDCTGCHKDGSFSNIQGDCISCHRKDYERADDPDHIKSNFPTDCSLCHRNQNTWEGAVFAHLNFPLEGIHKTLNCSECHRDGQFSGVSPACFSCHADDYNSAKDPDHKKSGFPTDCTACHRSMTTWEGAVFTHSSFQLEGAHKTLNCSECHGDGIYAGRSRECVSCHLKDYNNTSDPNHKNAGFPTSCDSCHSSSHFSWDQAVFNHNFPINSGKHSHFACSDCHLSSDYRIFSCTDCHEHTKSEMDKEHDDVSGYVYNSQNCYACHPNGIGD